MWRIGLMTLVVFVAGLLTGIWTQHLRIMPPPPMPPLGEMRAFDRSGPPGPARFPLSPEKAAEMEAAMARLRPQMEAFENKLQEIETTFRAKFDALLTPEQLAILKAKPAPPSEPPFAGQTPDRMMKPMGGMTFFTIITPVAEHFSKELNLTPEQRAQLLTLLQERRQQFFDLVDTNPPPSLELRRVAPGSPGGQGYGH